MDDKRKYDPEDIESLMMHKTFEELYPEEKTFILEHLDSATEYESMRKTLLTVIAASNDHDRIVADHAIKDNLLAEFGAQKHGGFTIWLNSILAWLTPPEMEWYRKPAYQMTFASIALLIGVFVFIPGNKEVRFADAAKPGEETSTTDALEINGKDDKPYEDLKKSEILEDKAEVQIEGLVEGDEGLNNLTFSTDQQNGTVSDPMTNTFDSNTEAIYSGSVTTEGLEKTKDDFVAEGDLDFKADRMTENISERKEELEDAEKALNKVVAVSAEKTASRTSPPPMVDDVAIDRSEVHDDAVGNAYNTELESIEISAVQVTSASDVETEQLSGDDFGGEALFSKKTEGTPVQASTRKYKDLIDLLFTAM